MRWRCAPLLLLTLASCGVTRGGGDEPDAYASAMAGGVLTVGGESVLRFARKLIRNETLHVLGVGGSNMENFFGCAGRGCMESMELKTFKMSGPPPFGPLDPWIVKRLRNLEARQSMWPRVYSPDFVFPQFLAEVSRMQGRRAEPDTGLGIPHVAVNVGQSARGPDQALECPANVLYDDADLVVVEYAINAVPPQESYVRLLVDKLLRLPKQPAVVLIDLHSWCLDVELETLHNDQKACREAVKDGELVVDRLQRQGSFGKMTPLFAQVVHDLGDEIGHISVKKAILPLLLKRDPRVWPPDQMTSDGIHPVRINSKVHLPKVFADALAAWVAMAVERANGTASPSTPPPLPPAMPLVGPHVVHCLNLMDNATIAFTRNGLPDQIAPHYRDARHPADWFFTAHPLDGTEEEKMRGKPGLAAVAPGAEVGIVVLPPHMLEHRGRAIDGLDGEWKITLSYLVAKDFVAAVQVLGCTGACTCNATRIDGGADPPEKAYTRMALVPFAFSHGHHLGCVVTLRSESVGAKTKFKLHSVSVQRVLPAPQERAARKTERGRVRHVRAGSAR